MKEIVLSDGTKVIMREPLVRDMRATNKISNLEDREFKMISNLIGIEEDKLDVMLYGDYQKLSKAFQDFLSLNGKTA